ncbi:hypothetical protein PHYBLDRAFT_68018 [Phycomyces blakesleeanus NRRL 1555(-)]|uniref:Uncharacterized protein n=1 Tax=Phycomyces blakesleeanus (strain ATCC 8743b / DSM 1359 / FGSC 10004 / NBRC 33097 / NRRL 1555) TaxID=763407 RepID=A0A167P3I4_PHYB8|nr:hypothetical protein PHYBLDRAFT_68018 [Phycomyces blakesleeanus NRRL 1555(-)]OAD77174.1 hypothetical protein PHYBLDRAFT_68018 [Phycomyces blakesleeanus NRRL 1555(-)]|eukprot:XP_018295214.1 hypothetical protein PHYBLDRAFT_68018 [Phycomyces blakesleeanus NRRL 1555(-)]
MRTDFELIKVFWFRSADRYNTKMSKGGEKLSVWFERGLVYDTSTTLVENDWIWWTVRAQTTSIQVCQQAGLIRVLLDISKQKNICTRIYIYIYTLMFIFMYIALHIDTKWLD